MYGIKLDSQTTNDYWAHYLRVLNDSKTRGLTEARIHLTAVMMILLYVGIFTYGVINYHG